MPTNPASTHVASSLPVPAADSSKTLALLRPDYQIQTPVIPSPSGILMALLAMLSLSLAPTLVKFGLSAHEAPIPLLAMRLFIATAVLWVIFAAIKPEVLRIDRRGLRLCALAAIGNAISLSSFYLSMQFVDASIGTVIFALHPAVVLLILMTRGEPLTQRRMIRLALALIGVILLIGIKGTLDWRGLGFAFGTMFFYSVFLVLLQNVTRYYPPTQVTLYVISFMALYIGVIFVIVYGVRINFSTTGWGVILFTAFISTALARFLLFSSIHRLGSGQVALLGPIETVLVVFWAMLFLGERLGLLQTVGAGLILFSAALVKRR
jgi:drug/metabolite transporter (DMT)-like permease